MKFILVAAYIATIFAANWAIATFGVIPVGLGLLAPAGVYFVGLAFPLRDYIQRVLAPKNRLARWAFLSGLVLIGAALSYFVSPHFALASGMTFLVSESVDTVVYTPLQKRFPLAVGLSSASALVVDSALFLWLAFGSEAFLFGQIVGKAEATVVGALIVVLLWKRRERLALLAGHAQA